MSDTKPELSSHLDELKKFQTIELYKLRLQVTSNVLLQTTQNVERSLVDNA